MRGGISVERNRPMLQKIDTMPETTGWERLDALIENKNKNKKFSLEEVEIILKNYAKDNNNASGMKVKNWLASWILEHH